MTLKLTIYKLFNFHVARLKLKSKKSARPAQLDQVSSLAILKFLTVFPFISDNNQEETAIESYRTNFSMPSMKLPQQFFCAHAQ